MEHECLIAYTIFHQINHSDLNLCELVFLVVFLNIQQICWHYWGCWLGRTYFVSIQSEPLSRFGFRALDFVVIHRSAMQWSKALQLAMRVRLIVNVRWLFYIVRSIHHIARCIYEICAVK